jgi:hypothetical protein
LASIAILQTKGGEDELMQKRTTVHAPSRQIKRHVRNFDPFALFTRSNREFDEPIEHLFVVVCYIKIYIHRCFCSRIITNIRPEWFQVYIVL